MRLLHYNEYGELGLVSFNEPSIPPYAILSHTWENEEVNFAEMQNNDGKDKQGYEKIDFCGRQAQRDGLQYFWVDTCCIDKTDNAELSHAIQSMFRWYQNAKRCYVYLSDVSIRGEFDNVLGQASWEPAFRASRWFRRGWTLQELLAPSIVEFFSQERERLGDKSSLKSWIRKITGISYKALDGAPLYQFSFDERLQWKGERETTREEDGWYSLSGIFGVQMAPAYGEGSKSAFGRLRDEIRKLESCLRDMHSTDPYDDKMPLSTNGNRINTADCCGSKAIPARERRCCSVVSSTTS
jgi:hypothetical protein